MEKEIIHSDAAPAAIGPYSQAIKSGNTVYVSGQIAYDASLKNDIELETNTVMDNLEHILKAAKLNFSNVVKATIFLKNMDDFAKVNEIYGARFSGNYPARETVQVAKLPKDVNVEISVIACY